MCSDAARDGAGDDRVAGGGDGQQHASELSEAEVWQLVVDHEQELRRACRKFLPRSMAHELDELYGDVVVDRAQRIMKTYDPAKGATPVGHLVIAVRWYAYKWVKRRRKCGTVELTEDSDAASCDGVPDAALRVSMLLDRLGETDKQILRWRYMQGFSLGEIADHLGVTTGQVKRMCAEALRRATTRGAHGVVQERHGPVREQGEDSVESLHGASDVDGNGTQV